MVNWGSLRKFWKFHIAVGFKKSPVGLAVNFRISNTASDSMDFEFWRLLEQYERYSWSIGGSLRKFWKFHLAVGFEKWPVGLAVNFQISNTASD